MIWLDDTSLPHIKCTLAMYTPGRLLLGEKDLNQGRCCNRVRIDARLRSYPVRCFLACRTETAKHVV
eukprot:886906-Amphidinium_carterae.1